MMKTHSSFSQSRVPLALDLPRPFGAYVHWPFCAAKCPYCDFNSHVAREKVDEARFLVAYQAEISYWADALQGAGMPPLSSVFFGGGTPSLMSPWLVEGILEALASHFGFDDGIEVTLEANPASVDAANFKALALAGVNRLSLGVQSFDDAALKALGRLHSADEARRAIDIAAANFSRFSFDLIYARPGQSLATWEAELATAFSFGPKHLSLYQLTIEPNTPYKALYDAGKLVLPQEELAADFYELTQGLCSAAGLPAYEVSNHAVAGHEARHNQLYWRYGDFLGIGPGAHGRVSRDGGRFSTYDIRLPGAWLAKVEEAGVGLSSEELLSDEAVAAETLLMGLRLLEGLSLARLEAETGFTIEGDVILAQEDAGLLECQAFGANDRCLQPTDKGLALNNHLAFCLIEGLRPFGASST